MSSPLPRPLCGEYDTGSTTHTLSLRHSRRSPHTHTHTHSEPTFTTLLQWHKLPRLPPPSIHGTGTMSVLTLLSLPVFAVCGLCGVIGGCMLAARRLVESSFEVRVPSTVTPRGEGRGGEKVTCKVGCMPRWLPHSFPPLCRPIRRNALLY